MRRDFHYYAVYAIARYAGIKAPIAEIVAYASEHVDDAKADSPIPLEGGGQLCPVRSAHSLLDPSFYESHAALAVYMPFHFFPSLKGQTLKDRAICQPESPGIVALKRQTLKQLRRSFGPHALGIALHVIADSYAHQGFCAIKAPANQVSHLAVHSSGLLDIALPTAAALLPPIAHLQATTCPDEPACTWSYTSATGHRIQADNVSRYLLAAEAIYHWLTGPVRRQQPDWYDGDSRPFEELKKHFQVLFSLNMLLKDRIAAWQQAYALQLFTPPNAVVPWQVPNYDPEAWQLQSPNHPQSALHSSTTLNHTNYFLMHTALAEHLHYCRYQLFPEHQVYI